MHWVPCISSEECGTIEFDRVLVSRQIRARRARRHHLQPSGCTEQQAIFHGSFQESSVTGDQAAAVR